MSRIDLIEQLHQLELRKVNFENLSNDVKSRYVEGVYFTAMVETRDFKPRYKDALIRVEHELFNEYLESEIAQLERGIQQLINNITSK